MHKFLVCAYKSQGFAQSQENLARLHDRQTVTFRKSAWERFKDPAGRSVNYIFKLITILF